MPKAMKTVSLDFVLERFRDLRIKLSAESDRIAAHLVFADFEKAITQVAGMALDGEAQEAVKLLREMVGADGNEATRQIALSRARRLFDRIDGKVTPASVRARVDKIKEVAKERKKEEVQNLRVALHEDVMSYLIKQPDMATELLLIVNEIHSDVLGL